MLALEAEGELVDPRVLLIERDVSAAHPLIEGLRQAIIQVAWAQDGMSGLALKARVRPEIVLVGLGLPESVQLVATLVAGRDCGVVVLAGPEHERARIECLERGADDFLWASPNPRDVIARVRAVRRRMNLRIEPATAIGNGALLVVGPIRINLQNRTVHTTEGRRLNLTSAEFAALETLARADGTAVSRDRLSETALRRPWRAEDRSVDQLVFNLRQKLPSDPEGGLLIQSIRGSGYWMRAPDRPARRRPEPSWQPEEMERPEQARISA